MAFLEQLKTEASRLGFSILGITSPDPPDHFALFENWLQRGFHASMSYLSTEKARFLRQNPDKLLAGCKSILVLGFPYPIHWPILFTASNRSRGRIASYALDNDYHNQLPPRLSALADWISNRLGNPLTSIGITDSAPVLERDLAVRAGLGWIGKNSCLISPQLGSTFLLAEIFLDVSLDTTTNNLIDRCGTCHRCIDACPTRCILPDRTIDASRCISYLTIEHKGPIPEDMRPLLQNWIFGCDICQMVCPWNRKAKNIFSDNKKDFDSERYLPLLSEELSLSLDDFHQKYENSPINRCKRSGYLRNVATALGNSADISNIPLLSKTLEDENDPIVRSHVAWALGQHNHPSAITVLKKAYFFEQEQIVREEILSALIRLAR